MADHNKPTLSSTYSQVLSEYDGRLKDMAAAFDPAYASVTNIPANAVRWSSAGKKWQYWNGTAWVDLASEYAISISGTAQKLKTARTFQISGGATAAAANFDGSGNVNLNVTVLDGSKLDNLTTSPTDTTAGRILKVGDWGIGGDLPVLTGGDLLADDDYYEYYVTTAVNAPSGALTTSGYVKKETRSSSFRKVTFTPFNLSTGPWVNVCNNGVWAGWVELYHSGNLGSDLQWLGTPIGGYITPLTPPPKDDPRFRYVLCTAGQDGPGGYNEGVLTDETVTGSAPLINASATVSLAWSPFDGLTIHLINTEGRFVGAGETEAFEDDSIQNITGAVGGVRAEGFTGGAFAIVSSAGNFDAGGGQLAYVDFEASRVARTSDHTQPRAHRLVHYRRIK